MTDGSEEQKATTTPAPRRWLERLKVNQFRSVEPGTELCFSDGLNVVLGKNASGKTTLLDLIAASLDLNFEGLALGEEPLDLEVVLRAGDFRIEAAVKRAFREQTGLGVPGGRTHPGRALLEEGHYTFWGPSGFRVQVVLKSDDLPRRTVEGVDPAPYGLDEPLGWRHQRPTLAPLLMMLPNLWFQGSLYKSPALGSLLGESAFSIGANDQALLRMPESDELLRMLEGDDFEICLGEGMTSYSKWLPTDMLALLPNDGTPIDLPLVHHPFLSAFVHEMGFSEVRMYLGPPRVEQRHGSDAFVYSSPTFTFYRDGRLARRGDQLSYGQRRLFALGWYLVCNRDIAVLDEPANGLHESWVEFLVSQLHDRQVFLTSQNREVLDMLPFRTETGLRRGFVLCESRLLGDDEPALHWRGLHDEEAALMIKALRNSRVDLVTDLLRALNLW